MDALFSTVREWTADIPREIYFAVAGALAVKILGWLGFSLRNVTVSVITQVARRQSLKRRLARIHQMRGEYRYYTGLATKPEMMEAAKAMVVQEFVKGSTMGLCLLMWMYFTYTKSAKPEDSTVWSRLVLLVLFWSIFFYSLECLKNARRFAKSVVQATRWKLRKAHGITVYAESFKRLRKSRVKAKKSI